MFQSNFEKLVSFPMLYKFLCHILTVLFFWSSVSRSHWLTYFLVPFLICQMWGLMVRQHSVSSKSVQKKTYSEGQCSSAAEKAWEAAKGTNGYPQCQLLIVLVFPSARGSSQQNFSWSYRLGSVAVVGCMTRVSTEIQLNLCPCNSRQVANCKRLSSSNLRNTYNYNLFLWKTCHFNFCSSVMLLSPELGIHVACRS